MFNTIAQKVFHKPRTTQVPVSYTHLTNEPRCEYVLVMAGAPETADPEQELTLEQAAQRALELIGQGFGPTAAAKAVSYTHLR